MGSFSLMHWVVVLMILAVPLVLVGVTGRADSSARRLRPMVVPPLLLALWRRHVSARVCVRRRWMLDGSRKLRPVQIEKGIVELILIVSRPK
jgi:hypothetical protein